MLNESLVRAMDIVGVKHDDGTLPIRGLLSRPPFMWDRQLHRTPPWERHTAGDEMLHILSGECRLTIREGSGETARTLRAGDLVVRPGVAGTATMRPMGSRCSS